MILPELHTQNPIYLELSDENHHKFYELCIAQTTVIATYGRIGRKGRTTIKHFPTPLEALQFFQRRTQQKLKRGYIGAVKGLTEPRTPKHCHQQLKIPFPSAVKTELSWTHYKTLL